ncbi:MAG: VCBS repeat-containing protein [Phycisphaerae bacterium]|nr:VCBS repeat-containing protein [Phycisphaerae bacterium]
MLPRVCLSLFPLLDEGKRRHSNPWNLLWRTLAAACGALLLAGAPAAWAGNCLVCDAGGDYASATNFPASLTNITLEAWVYHNQITNRVERYATVGSEVAVLRMDGASSPGQLHFYIKTSGTLRHLRVNNAITNGGWHHVAGTWNGTTMRLYKDGVELTNSTPGGTLDAPSGSIKVGRDSSEWLNGRIDEVRVWKVARTQEQIQRDMHLGLAAYRPGLVAYWKLDETSGGTAFDSGTNGVNLTLQGNAQFAPSDAPLYFTETSFDELYGRQYGTAAWGDYDKDGLLDLTVVGNGSGSVYHNTGENFSRDITTAYPGSGMAWGDYDNDGWLDMFYYGDELLLYHNTGQGTFTQNPEPLPLPGYADSFHGRAAWGDYNNDGYPDVLVADPAALYRNNGDGTFTNINIGFTEFFYADAAWGDYNNDGLLDILIAGGDDAFDGNDFTFVYRNNGDGTFTNIHADLIGVEWAAVAWGDYDNDGFLDIAISGIIWTSKVCHAAIYHNNGDGTFTDIHAGLTPVEGGGTAWGDFDCDGYPDLLMSGSTNWDEITGIARIYRNNHDGTFSDMNAGLIRAGWSSLSCGDYDNDGRLDIAMNGDGLLYNPDTGAEEDLRFTMIYHGYGPATNSPPTAPTNLSVIVSDGTMTLAWAEASDAETPSSGLTYNVRVGTSSGAEDILAGMADAESGLRRIPAMGNANENLSWTLSVVGDGPYFFSVQAVDAGFAGGPWAAEEVFPTGFPIVITAPVSNVTSVSADCGGNVTDEGDAPVTDRGVCWNTSGTPPTVADDHISAGSGAGPFSIPLTNLTLGIVYSVRAYASNSYGVIYGSQHIFATPMDPPGNALLFDGTSDYVNLGSDISFSVGNTLTIEAWVKSADLSARRGVFSTRFANTAGSFQLELGPGSGGANCVTVTAPSTYVAQTGNDTIRSNEWTHIAYVRAAAGAGNQFIYVNGSLTPLAIDTNYLFVDNASSKVIGSGTSGGQLFSGEIDELRVWSVARTEEQIRSAMRQELNGNEAGLAAYYRFDHVSGTVLIDLTTHGNTGTLVNGPVWTASTVPWFGLTATAGDHGAIVPTGTVYVARSGGTNYVITADEYWHVGDVTTNGASVGAVTNFTWTNVVANGTIHADFAADLAALGTPHWWLASFDLTNEGASFDEAEADDTDEDTFTAGDEYVADTDPTDSNSYFRVTGMTHDSPVTIYFDSSTGRLYTMQGATDLVDGTWTNVPGAGPRAGADGGDSMLDANEPPRGPFYRMEVQVP